jgi:uncharacterized membrane protein (UPF0127 family)
MIRAALVALLTVFLNWRAASVTAASAAVLPPASVIQSQPLPGLADKRVIVYRSAGSMYLAIARSGAQGAILWKLHIEGQVTHLLVAGPAGVFAAVTRRPVGSSVYAFRAGQHGVTSALASRPHGEIYGDEGVVVLRRGFQVRERDWKHRGSVQYRYTTEYDLNNGEYVVRYHRRAPNYPPNLYPTPNAVFHTRDGSTVLVRLEVASTEAQREYGLMYRPSLDPDSGMVFVWESPVQDSFWMENTLIPLTVAFIGSNDRVEEIQDMQAETCDLHTPSQPYQYAIEANLGYFAANGVMPGDQVTFHLAGAPAPLAAPRPPGTPVASCGTR